MKTEWISIEHIPSEHLVNVALPAITASFAFGSIYKPIGSNTCYFIAFGKDMPLVDISEAQVTHWMPIPDLPKVNE